MRMATTTLVHLLNKAKHCLCALPQTFGAFFSTKTQHSVCDEASAFFISTHVSGKGSAAWSLDPQWLGAKTLVDVDELDCDELDVAAVTNSPARCGERPHTNSLLA